MGPRSLKPGLYGPLPTFFTEQQEIDYASYKSHLLNLATKGIVPVCAGSLGEAVHLTHDERVQLIHFIRATLDEAGLNATPIVAGVGGSSTRETIKLARDAEAAGADAGLVILPAYYAASLAADAEQIIQYYVDICNGSPIPLFLYNFPSNAAGLDISSAQIEAVMRQTTNLCGVKLTYVLYRLSVLPPFPSRLSFQIPTSDHPAYNRCGGSISKLIRLTAAISTDPTINAQRPYPFLLLDGLIADLTPWMQNGGHGTVSGIPNFAPAASARLWELLNKSDWSEDEQNEAKRIQAVLSRADVAAVPAGVRGMKYVLNKLHGHGPHPRRPLLPLGSGEGEELMVLFGEMFELEAEYAKA
ncbi:putative dihydrodipicolinate synthase [Pseudomassariella vexata]|uniref:Putative dihydrodipicolinate synthase n=1 Tax=Pseudomassariella vexata TaxID=1141098 RepID=A0A1Y2DCB1_9PEZI|nr:putative dihydrodipicolinate synthase [Pseudomassariella vexata]ORY56912.1 putative dihydrodipicolinate synthase [Pseudomassariella vexata]